MKTITIRVREDLHTRLEALASERGWSKSALVRAALEQLVRDKPRSEGPSCYELASDLAGTFDGPSDLSDDKQHLEGYGR